MFDRGIEYKSVLNFPSFSQRLVCTSMLQLKMSDFRSEHAQMYIHNHTILSTSNRIPTRGQ